MNTSRTAQVIATLLAVLSVGLITSSYFFFAPSEESKPVLTPINVLPVPATARISFTPGVERWYTNKSRSFSFRLPDGFSAPDIENDKPGVSGVVVRNEGVDQLLVLVYEVPLVETLTVTGIEEVLGATLSDVKEIFIDTVVQGIQFRTVDGFEVWTMHNGQLYRMLTSAENKDLLTFITSNWFFAPPAPSVQK